MVRPYDRPDLDQRKGGLALYITGALPNAKPTLAYEGRLQFHNAIGQATADLFDGALPLGYSISVDSVTSEIVVTWPAYQAAAAPIENSGFESGDKGWDYGAGWSVTTNNPITGTKSAVFQNTRGESMLSSKTRYPISAGQTVSAGCSVRQGASSSGNAGGAVCLEYRDAAGNILHTAEGNRVMSASNNAVKPSNVTYTATIDCTINIAGKGIRKRQNRDVWMDGFFWNLTQPAVGINVESTIGPITIRLVDSVGRTAFWTGTIRVANYTPFEFPVAGTTGLNQTIFSLNIGGGALMVAGWNNNLRRSVDGGATWAAVDYTNLGWPVGQAIDNIWDDPDTGLWYMSYWEHVAVSSDRGATWTQISGMTNMYDRSVSKVDGVWWASYRNGPTTTIAPVFGGAAINLGNYWYAKRIAKIGGFYYVLTASSDGTGRILRGATLASCVPVHGVLGQDLEHIAVGNGVIVVGSTAGNTIAVSADNGATWTTYTNKPSVVFFYAARGKFYSGNGGDEIYESTDGVNYTQIAALTAGGSATMMGAMDELGQTFFVRSQGTHNTLYSGDA